MLNTCVSVIAGLARCYVTAIQDGAVPCIENAVDLTAQIVNAEALDETLQQYKSQMETNLTFPTESQDQLSEMNLRCQKEATSLFLNRVVFDKDRKSYTTLTVA